MQLTLVRIMSNMEVLEVLGKLRKGNRNGDLVEMKLGQQPLSEALKERIIKHPTVKYRSIP